MMEVMMKEKEMMMNKENQAQKLMSQKAREIILTN